MPLGKTADLEVIDGLITDLLVFDERRKQRRIVLNRGVPFVAWRPFGDACLRIEDLPRPHAVVEHRDRAVVRVRDNLRDLGRVDRTPDDLARFLVRARHEKDIAVRPGGLFVRHKSGDRQHRLILLALEHCLKDVVGIRVVARYLVAAAPHIERGDLDSAPDQRILDFVEPRNKHDLLNAVPREFSCGQCLFALPAAIFERKLQLRDGFLEYAGARGLDYVGATGLHRTRAGHGVRLADFRDTRKYLAPLHRIAVSVERHFAFEPLQCSPGRREQALEFRIELCRETKQPVGQSALHGLTLRVAVIAAARSGLCISSANRIIANSSSSAARFALSTASRTACLYARRKAM